MSGARVRVERFDPARHHVGEFSCGRTALDRWLQAYAGQAQRRDVARTFVAAAADAEVVGYYTLVAGQVEHSESPAAVRAGVSSLIARLAVASSSQRGGLGTDLMRDALRRIVAAAEQIGIRAVLVHAIDRGAAGFYARLGFEASTPDGLTLMVPLVAGRHQLDSG